MCKHLLLQSFTHVSGLLHLSLLCLLALICCLIQGGKMDLHQVTLRNIRTTLVGLMHMLGRQRPPQLHAAPFHLVESNIKASVLGAIGEDVLMVELLPKIRYRDLRALACASRSLHTLVAHYKDTLPNSPSRKRMLSGATSHSMQG